MQWLYAPGEQYAFRQSSIAAVAATFDSRTNPIALAGQEDIST